MEEKQEHMRRRVRERPCADGRSRQARRARARLIRAEEVEPRTVEWAAKRRAARFMRSHNFSLARIANQLGLTVPQVEEMLSEEAEVTTAPVERAFGPSEGVQNLLRGMEREKRRERDPFTRILNPDTEVTFVPAFAGDVRALSKKEEAERREEMARVRHRESCDAGERRPR